MKYLIFAPHPDDEVLGCGGLITAKREDTFQVCFATAGRSDEESALRLMEAEAAGRIGEYQIEIMFDNVDGILNNIDTRDIVSKIEGAINRFRPDVVLCNLASSHQDHETLYKAMRAAIRIRNCFLPRAICWYEYPYNCDNEKPCGGHVYLPLTDKRLSEKIKLYEQYKTQQKEQPSPLNPDGIIALARKRGMECGNQYAECYFIERLVIS